MWLLVLCAIGAAPMSGLAQAPEGDPNNAATWYRAASAEARRIGFETIDVYEPVWAFQTDPDRGPSAEARTIMRRAREAVDLARRGARREYCDYAPYDEFEHNSTADLAAMRAAAQTLRNDYWLRVFDGDVDGAMEDVHDTLRIATHAAFPRQMMGVLVGTSLVFSADRLVQFGIDRAIIGPGEASQLLRELEEFKGDDPLGYRQAIIIDQSAYVDMLVRRYSGDGGLERYREEQQSRYRQQNDLKGIADLERIQQEDLDRLLESFRRVQDRIVAAARIEDIAAAHAALNDIDKEVAASAHAMEVRSFLGRSAQTFNGMLRVRTLLDDRRTTLKGLADGSIDPLSLANAACWYIRASVQIEHVHPEALALIDAHSARADPNAAIDPKLSEGLKRDDVRAVLERLATAATIERCDFSYATGNWTRYYRPYHAGVLACGRLVAVDAMRLLSENKRDEAVARLAQLMRLSSEVSRDGCIAGTLTAHRLFDSADAVIMALVERGLDAGQISTLRAALERFGRGDPFYYQPAIASLRTHTRGWLMWLMRGAPSVEEQLKSPNRPATEQENDDADAILNRCDADRVLSILAACEEWSMRFGQVPKPIRAPIEGLWPIVDVEALQRSRDMLPDVLQWAKMHAIDAVPLADLPVIAPIEARSKQSLEDFRTCLRRLGVSEIEPAATQP